VHKRPLCRLSNSSSLPAHNTCAPSPSLTKSPPYGSIAPMHVCCMSYGHVTVATRLKGYAAAGRLQTSAP
jgi:hypothetical protein